MDAPDRERDIRRSQRLVPREHVLIHAVDQRPVEIEEEGIAYHRAGPRHAIPLLRRGCSAEVGDEILRLSGDGVNAVAGAVERGAEPEAVGARLAPRPRSEAHTLTP